MKTVPQVVVCEDPSVQKLIEAILERNGFRVLSCEPSRAIEMIQSSKEMVHLVITNAPLEFEAVRADVPLLYISGSPSTDLVSQFSRWRVLTKPFRPEELLSAVNALIGPI